MLAGFPAMKGEDETSTHTGGMMMVLSKVIFLRYHYTPVNTVFTGRLSMFSSFFHGF